MVKRICVLTVILALIISLTAMSLANAQERVYSFDHQWAQIFINQDGTIDLTYNLTLTLHSGTDIHAIDIGQPKGDFTIGQAVDQYGHQLQTSDDSSGSDYRVRVTLNQPLTAGNTIWFTLTTNVAGMISNDTQNPGNLGMEFAPEWMSVPINDVRVQIVLPLGVAISDVKTTQNFYNSTSLVEGRLAVYWEKPVLQPNEQFLVGVSFPAKYLPNYYPSQVGGLEELEISILLFGLAAFAIFVIGFIVFKVQKKHLLNTENQHGNLRD